MKRFLATLLIVPGLSAAAFAAEIRILSAGAVESGLQAFAQVAKRETGHDFKTLGHLGTCLHGTRGSKIGLGVGQQGRQASAI